MDILKVSAHEWVLNEEENLKRLLFNDLWYKLPLINVDEVHNVKDGSLVRFRGMIQDMFGSEFYLEKFNVINEVTKEITTRNSKYYDCAVSSDKEQIDFGNRSNVVSERYSYVVISLPGLNTWVYQHEKGRFTTTSKPQTSSCVNPTKRSIEDMEVDEDASTNLSSSSKKLSTKPQPKEQAKNNLLVSRQHILNHPLSNDTSKVCYIKVYHNNEMLKINDTCDFVGFLSVNPVMQAIYDEDDGFESPMEMQTHHPPSSLVPRIHVVYFKPLDHINPLVDEVIMDNLSHMAAIKRELLIVLTQLLIGDALAAEYLLYHLISEVYLRRDFMPLGKFAVNISNVPKLGSIDYVLEVYKFLELLVPKSHYMALTLDNMNTLDFTPKKDYECNRLTSGILQLSKNTHLVLDETKMEEGKLTPAGVQNIKTLTNTIKNQKVMYDFGYYTIEYECNIPFLIFSEGKSMLPSDVHVAMKPDDQCMNTFNEILEAARHFLKPELLNNIRKYLTQARLSKYEISDPIRDLIQEEFVNMRQNSNIVGDDLHSLLVLSRLICISEGKSTLDEACWRKACDMENERKARLSH